MQGEHIHLLHALDYPPDDAHLTATEALRYPAIELFMERAAASGYSSGLSDADAPIVASICRKLDGIALAIELAGSRVGSSGSRGPRNYSTIALCCYGMAAGPHGHGTRP